MKKTTISCSTKKCFLCANAIEEWIPAIELYKKTMQFKRGEIIFREGDNAEGVYFINSGVVKVFKTWEDEKQLIIRFAKQGDLIGHRNPGTKNTYAVSVTALDTVHVCFVEMSFFMKTLKVNPEITFKMMALYGQELEQAERRMRDLAHMDVRGRIADTLLMLKNKFDVDVNGYINIELTRQDIASFAGTIYETFFKIVNEFVKARVIRFSGKKIKILKVVKLEEYAGNLKK